MNDSFGGLCSTICKICSVPTVSDCFRLFPTVSVSILLGSTGYGYIIFILPFVVHVS